MSRPESTGHASLFYNAKEARKYHTSSRMINVQREITQRAIELLRLESGSPAYILDVGCGSGLSGDVLEQAGHFWVGCDVSRDMLLVATERIQQDMEGGGGEHKKRESRRGGGGEEDDDDEEEDDDGDEEDSDDEMEGDEGSDDDDAEPISLSTGDLLHHVRPSVVVFLSCMDSTLSLRFCSDNHFLSLLYLSIAVSTRMKCVCTHFHNTKSTLSFFSFLQDMGTGLPFRPATFDACVSISALQWLCYSNSNAQIPKRRLIRFFSSLYSVLKKNGRAVLQFYPETADQAVLITECATSVGFGGGVVVDYPNSAKAKKHYLVLNCNRTVTHSKQKNLPAALLLENNEQASHVQVGYNNNNRDSSNKKQKPIRKKKGMKTKEWIVHKKETQRKKGKTVRADTKYTARRRPTKF
jgi:18S rRNA (guanine1575-N7)-methyltransferase